MDKKVWLIGAGNMASQYAMVLLAQKVEFTVIGRGDKSADKFTEDTGIQVMRGGVERYCDKGDIPDYAIVTVSPSLLADVSNRLIEAGVKNLLIEKPGGMTQKEIEGIASNARDRGANAYIAYNRRFYASVMQAKKMIEEDGGVTSFNFEFTEWGHVISQYSFSQEELDGWFLANSTHVVDLAFYLGGIPESFSGYIGGRLDWHPKADRYSGAGRTNTGALFSYKANWASAGRWSVEVLTDKRKYIFEPLESLKTQEKGTVTVVPFELDDALDTRYKPGLYRQTEAFLTGDNKNLINVEEHARMACIYELMETNGSYKSADEWKSFQKIG